MDSQVWIPDEELVWVKATAHTSIHNDQIEVTPEDGSRAGQRQKINMRKAFDSIGAKSDSKAMQVPLVNENLKRGECVKDMCYLDYLHEPAVLKNLELRHALSQPYTYTGSTCIAVNPYAWLDLFDEKQRSQYFLSPSESLEPHVYSLSARAFTHMHLQLKDQSILVSGESGAGKTETVKILMNHLAFISESHSKEQVYETVRTEGAASADRINQNISGQNTTVRRVLESNPLLESFGNAKTLKNDNSSRFGKFVQLQFDYKSMLCGAHAFTYLLEKSRVVHQAQGERNYHILYQLLSSSEFKAFGLGISDFKFLSAGADMKGSGDEQNFEQTKTQLNTLGFSAEQQGDVFKALAGVLQIGEIRFEGVDVSKVSPGEGTSALEKTARLLGLTPGILELALTSRQLVTRNGASFTRVMFQVEESERTVEATTKNLYMQVFEWLVHSINQSTSKHKVQFLSSWVQPQDNVVTEVNDKGEKKLTQLKQIGLLDIFGFEVFEHNSLEQLCINYANETLQQKFCMDVFKSVSVEYTEEGVTLPKIDFADNKVVLDFVESRMGLLSLLNEECLQPGGADEKFTAKVLRSFKDCPILVPERIQKGSVLTNFTVVHYAAKVSYDTTGWLAKNKDTLHRDIVAQLQKSTNPFVVHLFPKHEVASPVKAEKSGKQAGKSSPVTRRGSLSSRKGSSLALDTVAATFRTQLKSLMASIEMTEVQYARCIKPNPSKSATAFDRKMVAEQLRSAGVVEAIRMARAAYPNRMLKVDFARRFMMLRAAIGSTPRPLPRGKIDAGALMLSAAETKATMKEAAALVEELVKALPKTQALKQTECYTLGKTKIFFNKAVLEALEDSRLEYLTDKVVAMESLARGFIARKRYKFHQETKTAIVKIQAWGRGRAVKQNFATRKRTIIQLQSQYRGKKSRAEVSRLRTRRAVEAAAKEVQLKKEAQQLEAMRKQKVAVANAAARAAQEAMSKRANQRDAIQAVEAKQRAEREARAQGELVKQKQEDAAAAAKEAADRMRIAKQREKDEENNKRKAKTMEKEALQAAVAAKKQEEEMQKQRQAEVSASMHPGMEYDVEFDEGSMGLWLLGNKVQDLVKDGQAQLKGVIPGSCVLEVAHKKLDDVWSVAKMIAKETRPVHVRFRKPAMSDIRQNEVDAELAAREYAVNFEEGSLGTEIDSRLIVRGITPGSQAEREGVIVGSAIVTIDGQPVQSILEVVKIMRDSPKPVEMRLRKPKQTITANRRSSMEQQQAETKKQEYLAWLYGNSGKNNELYRQNMTTQST